MLKIFIVAEESVEVRQLTSELTHMGFICSVANDSSHFSEELKVQACDVLLVDIDSPLASARIESILDQVRELRRRRVLPTIALISVKELNNIDSRLEIDDFIVKPWNLAEVAARAKRVIKQVNDVQGKDLIRCGALMIDIAKCEVSIDGRLLDLTFKEYELLKFLALNPGRVFTREALLNEVWGYDYYGGDRTVDVHIRRLRSKLGESGNSCIQTVRNIGYKFSEVNESDLLLPSVT